MCWLDRAGGQFEYDPRNRVLVCHLGNIDVHVTHTPCRRRCRRRGCLPAHDAARALACLVLDTARARDARVAQCCTRSHEQRIVHVPRVSKNDEVEVQQPRLLPAQDREVRGVQCLVRERLMHHRRHVVCNVIQSGRREVRVRCGRATLRA